ncbi:hypothetical protein SAY87_030549 [Trapa incisa]|uniref:Uncharacterized protein n=1 Tax=Trapa incisa TaxID=236973 RepID=A0AAN7KVW0_9MYRT|nr:hypothetical protein SAY87_030549 [Trapa incisa]
MPQPVPKRIPVNKLAWESVLNLKSRMTRPWFECSNPDFFRIQLSAITALAISDVHSIEQFGFTISLSYSHTIVIYPLSHFPLIVREPADFHHWSGLSSKL